MATPNGGYTGLMGTSAASIGVTLAIVSYMGQQWLDPVRNELSRFDRELAALRVIVNASIGTTEIQYRFAVLEKKAEDAASDRRRITEGIIHKDAILEKWRSIAQEQEQHNKKIEELSARLGGVWSLRDGINEIQKRIDRIQAIYQNGKNGNGKSKD